MCLYLESVLNLGTSTCKFFPNRVPGMPQAQVAQLQVDLFNLVYPNRARGKGDSKCDIVNCVKGKCCWEGPLHACVSAPAEELIPSVEESVIVFDR